MNMRLLAPALCALGASFAASASFAIPTQCSGTTPYFRAVGGNIICSDTCATTEKKTEFLAATSQHFAGKFCVAACTAEFSHDDGGTCTVRSALDKFQDTCTGLNFALRIDANIPVGNYRDSNGNSVKVSKATYVNKDTSGGWMCGNQCPSKKTINVTGDGDAVCK